MVSHLLGADEAVFLGLAGLPLLREKGCHAQRVRAGRVDGVGLELALRQLRFKHLARVARRRARQLQAQRRRAARPLPLQARRLRPQRLAVMLLHATLLEPLPFQALRVCL